MRGWARLHCLGHLCRHLCETPSHQAVTVSEGPPWPLSRWYPWRTVYVGCTCGRAWYGRLWAGQGEADGAV